MRKNITLLLLFLSLLLINQGGFAQTAMTNIMGRKLTSLNGKWNVVIDPFDVGMGDWKAIYKDKKPTGKNDFVEYSFDLGPTLDVPGDFNSQIPELTYYESTIWYKKTFQYVLKPNQRVFVHFGAVNYKADVFFNGEKLGSHEGGFTPFQFELTQFIKSGENSLIVRTNNARLKDGIPGIGFDWFNYGGITREVNLVETPETFVEDYFIQLKKDQAKLISGYIKLNGKNLIQNIQIQIPEVRLKQTIKTNAEGIAYFQLKAEVKRWTPEVPKQYKVLIINDKDTIQEEIGFRNIAVKGTEILLNDKPIFLKGVNIHEEISQRRAYSESDALVLLNWAKELGCNFVRLVHYPHSEHTVKLAEKMGLLVWDELPIYQHIDFGNAQMKVKMELMLREMIQRDKNRANVIIWSLANETYPSPARNEALKSLISLARTLDSTRLLSCAMDRVNYNNGKAIIEDELNALLDVMAVNEYFGWYRAWYQAPGEISWSSNFNKPLIISEFGGEAMYGNMKGQADIASTWSEEYQAQIYYDQIKMFKTIPFLSGTCPWILIDYRSPVRMHPLYQNGWNRKGLLSDRGEKKKAWYVMKTFYSK